MRLQELLVETEREQRRAIAVARRQAEDRAREEEARRRRELNIRYDIRAGNDLNPHRTARLTQQHQDRLRDLGIAPHPPAGEPAADEAPGGWADNPELQRLQAAQAPDDDESGVALRFAADKHPKTGNPVVFAYWTNSRTPSYADAKGLGTTRSVGEIYSHTTVELIDELIRDTGAVLIIIDKKIESQYPKDVANLRKWVKKKEGKKGYEGFLYIEDDEETWKKPASITTRDLPTAEISIPNSVVIELQQKVMVRVRSDKDLNARYQEADPATRKRALDAAVKFLHKTKDIDGAIDEVDAIV